MKTDDLWILSNSSELCGTLLDLAFDQKPLPPSHTLLGRAFDLLVNRCLVPNEAQGDLGDLLSRFEKVHSDSVLHRLSERIQRRMRIGSVKLIAMAEGSAYGVDPIQKLLLWHNSEKCFFEFDNALDAPARVFRFSFFEHELAIAEWAFEWLIDERIDLRYFLFCFEPKSLVD